MLKIDNEQLKAFLLDFGLADEKVIDEAVEESKKLNIRLSDFLVKKGIVKEDEMIKLKAYILGIPFVNLAKENIDPKVLNIIPEPIARAHNIVAYKKRGNDLEVAMVDPEDIETIEFIRKKSNLNVLPRLTDFNGIKSALKQYTKSIEEEIGGLIGTKKEKKDDEESLTSKIVSPQEREKGDEKDSDLKKAASDLPVVKIVDSILKHAIEQGASDIHIEPAEKEVIVRYRIDGILHDAMILPKQLKQGVVARIKVLSNLKLDEHRLPQDGRFKIETDDYKISFRVSILPVFDGEKIVMRLLREDSSNKMTLDSLGLMGESLKRVERAIKKPVGMFLVTGPTGSGKTTTLYTVLDMLNTPEVNISTIEDPVEYRMPRVNQTQVRPEIGMTFAAGLRALLRQDPNIIMVGEIRDQETASLAVNAALTGHMVLSTLHTNSAAGALPRLIDMGVEPFLIASTVNAILAQRLVRRLCKEKQEYKLSKDEIKSLSESIDMDSILKAMIKEGVVSKGTKWEDISFYKAKPTKECPSGYKGRLGIYEVLEISDSIRELIVKKASNDEILNLAKKEGMITMIEDGFIKAAKGLTTIEEVLRVTKE